MSPPSWGRVASWATLLGVCVTGVAHGATTTRISYLAGSSVYVEAGRLEGLREGDTLQVIREAGRIASLRVTYLSSHRASCDTFAVIAPLRVGDGVRFEPRPISPVEAARSTRAAAAADSTSLPVTAPERANEPRRAPRAVRGRLGLRYLSVEGSGAAGTIRQPALDLRLEASDLGGMPLSLSADVRSRRTSWTRADGEVESDGQARAYRMSLGVHSRGGGLRATLGRQASPSLAAVSLFDGLLLEMQAGRWSGGIFSGTQPASADLGWSSDVLEYGAFAGVRSRPGTTRRWRVDTGGISSYENGQPNRDFLFAQGAIQDRRLMISATQEVDINRGWKIASGEPSVSPTSTFLLARVQIVEPFAIQAGFDNRRNVRLYRDRLTPETDFDDRYRQGAWSGMSLELWRHLRLDGDYRHRGASDPSDTWSGGAQWYGLAPLPTSLRARYSQYRSAPTESGLMMFSLGVDPGAGCHLETSLGTRTTTDRGSGIEERVDWESVDLDVALARTWYLNGSFESDRGGVDKTKQAYGGLSWRF